MKTQPVFLTHEDAMIIGNIVKRSTYGFMPNVIKMMQHDEIDARFMREMTRRKTNGYGQV